jgi:hypothetical protein
MHLVRLTMAASMLAVPQLRAQTPAPNPLAMLQPMIGEWAPVVPDSVLQRRPQLRNQVVHGYQWTVGQNAIRLREGYPRGEETRSELDGLIYWDPSRQQVLFVAVAGHGEGAGRLFYGEYTRLSDGRIERVYDVHYRTRGDMPGEEFGGTRRRYREIYTLTPDGRADAQLDWWHEGRWQPFGPGHYSMKRIP